MKDHCTPKADLRLIERSFPEGTIYTIYSLNLRHLFELENERNIRKEIDDIKLKSIIVTWIKARYLQYLFDLNSSDEEKEELSIKNNSISSLKEQINNLYKEFSNRNSRRTEGIIAETELTKNFIRYLINIKGEVFYFDPQISPKYIIEELFKRLKDFKIYLEELNEAEKKIKKNLYYTNQKNKALEVKIISKQIRDIEYKNKIENINSFFGDNLDKYGEPTEVKESKTNFGDNLDKYGEPTEVKESKTNLLLEKLDLYHREINEYKRAKNQELYKQIRKAEEFLASDEFGKFSKDPFFKIAKPDEIAQTEKRAIKVSGKKRELEEVTDEENKLLEDGHEFSIFRGHLKNNWLNALTYKIVNHSENTSYYIRLSKLGILQIRKETYLETYSKKKSKNLIDVLKDILEYQRRYDNENEFNSQANKENEVKNSDDILEVAAGFAKLLEFKTNSNYSNIFNQEIFPLSIEELRKNRRNLERQKYTVLLFNDLKKAKNKDEYSKDSFSPLDLKKNAPEAISCFLQGSLEEANASHSEGIKILQFLNEIKETGKLDRQTMLKLKVKNKLQTCKKSEWSYDELPSYQKKKIDEKTEGNYLIPESASLEENDYIDLSTLKNELCIFTAERGFIFFNDKKTLESGNKISNYSMYWKCIVRAVEYTVALRATLQLLESRTTRLLESVPEILELSNPEKNNEETSKSKNSKENSEEAEKRVENLAKDLASVLKILPGLRSIAIPTNAFRSGHSVKKFDYLYNDCFNFEDIFGNIQKNIDELTNFLTFFEQKQEAKEDKKLSKIALLFTTASILYISVSFMGDFYTFISFDSKQPVSLIKIILFVIYTVSIGIVWRIIGKIDSNFAFLKIIKRYWKIIITLIPFILIGFVIYLKYYLI